MNYGFIYCLGNQAMPETYKIGMSVRSPRHRCDELTAATGVPCEFQLLFYGDVEDAREAEAWMHGHLDYARVNHQREFFKEDVDVIFDLFEKYSETVAVTNDGRYALHYQDLVRKFDSAETDAARAEALINLAGLEGVRLWVEDGVVRTSVPHHFYMSNRLRCAVQYAGAAIAPFLPDRYIPKARSLVLVAKEGW
jgi:hypothetical protein